MINYNLEKIKALVFDVDGVLSRETIMTDSAGTPVRTVNIKDGYALQLAIKMGYLISIITGGKSEAVRQRYATLGIKEINMGCNVKLDVFNAFLQQHDLKPEEVIYMGDDIPDLEVMNLCGCPCCPADAVQEVKEISCYISSRKGGEGCVRDVVEQVMRAQGNWLKDRKAFGW